MELSDIKRIAVIGAGLMGHGIAQEFALSGYDVRLHDLSNELLTTAKDNIRQNLDMLAEAGIVDSQQAASVPDKILTSTRLDEVVEDADLVIEAISEDIDIKKKVFGELDELCPKRTIIASNSSTFMPSLVASATNRPDKILVTHYFNPPYLVPLVELVRHEGTSDETFDVIYALLKKIGKRPVVVQKEMPGFIGNRLQIALMRECLSLVESGVASPQDVDTVVKYGFGRRLAAAGPFELFDLAGWDVISAVIAQLIGEISAAQEVSSVVKDRVSNNHLGVKTGKGMYDWNPESISELRQRLSRALLDAESRTRSE